MTHNNYSRNTNPVVNYGSANASHNITSESKRPKTSTGK